MPEISDVFLTHYHADHYLGLPGMLKTFALRGRELPLTVYGPAGLTDLFASLQRVFGKLPYPLDLQELRPGDVVRRAEYQLVAFAVDHDVPAVGYALIEDERPGRFDLERAQALGVPPGPLFGRLQHGEPVELQGRKILPQDVLGPVRAGRKLVISGDTRPCVPVLEMAQGADVLVHDGTFLSEERSRAEETGHSTASQAAELARLAKVGLLVLTHLSSRYFGSEVVREARQLFPETVVPRDFDTVELRFAERGGAQLVKGGALTASARERDDSAGAAAAEGESDQEAGE